MIIEKLLRELPRPVLLMAILASSAPAPVAQQNLLAIPEVAREDVICFALYTVHAGTLKLTAQLYPLLEGEPREVWLEIEREGEKEKHMARRGQFFIL